jgi:hypothetical protein
VASNNCLPCLLFGLPLGRHPLAYILIHAGKRALLMHQNEALPGPLYLPEPYQKNSGLGKWIKSTQLRDSRMIVDKVRTISYLFY